MKGGLSSDSWGFTIVETMIVLAVSGVILTSALVLVSGRQDRTQFAVAIAQIQLQLQQYINDVSNGFVPSAQNFTCIANPSGVVVTPSGSSNLGSNKGCIVIGQAVQVGDGTTNNVISTFPVVGRRQSSTGAEVTTLTEATPKALAGPPVDLSGNQQLDAGMTVDEMWIGTNRSNRTNAIGFFTNLASYESTNNLKSGQLQVNLYNINGTQVGSSLSDAANRVNAVNMTKVNQVQICFISGTTNQSGLVTVGGQAGSELSVTLDIRDGKVCA